MLDLGRTLPQNVECGPNTPAIVGGDLKPSHAQWLTRVQSVTAGLLDPGLRPDERSSATPQNRWEMATLHWVCQFTGTVIVPLNWRVKPDELDYCVCDANARALVFEPVSADAVLGSLAAAKIPRIVLGGAPHPSLSFDTLLGAAPRPDSVLPEADDASLMLYISGTTERSRGMPRRHRQECAAALAHVAQNLYRRGERTLGMMPLHHMMDVRSLLAMALMDGPFVCVRRRSPSQTLQVIADHRVSCFYLIPTLYHDLLADPGFDALRMRPVTKLGFVGAAMNDGLLKRLEQAFHPELFVNHYGSSKVYTFSVGQRVAGEPGSAGRAGFNTRLRLVRLGTNLPDAVAAPGEEGQIIVELCGDEASKRYQNRDDANAKFLRQGWYFTGDTGYLNAEGDLFVSGRVDDMIISGGKNISPADIESVLSLHPAVDEVAVAGLPDPCWGQKVVVPVKPHDDVDVNTLDAYRRDSELANSERPRDHAFVADTLKSPVGKVLRRKPSEGEYTAPSSPSSHDLNKE